MTLTTAGVADVAAPARPQGGRQANKLIDQAERERRGCEVCKQWFPAELLEWHHIDGRERMNMNFSGRIGIANQARATMMEEWEACICVCPTCHAVADYEREYHANSSI